MRLQTEQRRFEVGACVAFGASRQRSRTLHSSGPIVTARPRPGWLRELGIRPVAPVGRRTRLAGGRESLTTTEQDSRTVPVPRRLYLSPHSVNTHLRHVFAKLGVSNRVALAAVVHHLIE